MLPAIAPDFRLLEVIGENRYRGVLNIAVGPLRGAYEGRVIVSEVDTPVGFRVDFVGEGQQGGAAGYGRIRLIPHNQTTLIQYEGEIEADGQLASLAPRLVQANINAVIRRLITGVARALGVEPPPPTRAASPWETQPRAFIAAGLLMGGGLIIAAIIGKKLSSGIAKGSDA